MAEMSFAGNPVLERVVELARERKAREIVALDLRTISTATDAFLIMSGGSDVQVRAIADHILDELREEGFRPSHVEGLQSGQWVLIDLIDLVVHVFHPTPRAFYQLEELWGDAPRKDFPSD
jgi:ribosome-associated protein